VDLAPVADGALVAQQVALALHVPERPGTALLEPIVRAVGEERVLLVLDNCEHLADACAELAEALLRACPRLAVLATSREALAVAGETAWLVPPLARAEAVRLFAERARAAWPPFALTPANEAAVDEICRRLDGIPLAIELAAARVRVLSPEQIARRLDDAFALLTTSSRTALPRHRTLWATMEWSHALLGAREQTLLRRLAVFAGSFGLDAAEAVCAGDGLAVDDILDGVAALVDKSLLVLEPGDREARYRMLETVRQYGMERLATAGERDALERRHAEHFLAVAEAAAPRLHCGEHEPGLVARLGLDNDNLRAAMAWTLGDAARAPLALRFAAALFWYWLASSAHLGAGNFRESRRFVTEALALGAACDATLRARALSSMGLLGIAQGEYDDTLAALEEALALLGGRDEPELEPFVRGSLSATLLMLGQVDRAWAEVEAAHGASEAVRPLGMLHAWVGSWRGFAALARGDLATARAMHERGLAIARVHGHRTTFAHASAFLGGIDLVEGRADDAYARFRDALPYHLELGDPWGIALDIEGMSAVAGHRGRHADAARLMGAVDALRERSALVRPTFEDADRARRLAEARARLGAAFDAAYAEGRALRVDEAARIATATLVAPVAEASADAPAEGPEVAPAAAPAGAPMLRVLALGPLQVLVGGRPVAPSAWGSARTRELLVYLLLHPEGRTKEQVGLAFWPEASSAQLRNNVHVTLHRLRKALGHAEWVALADERYRVDPAAVEEFDAAWFEREVGEARRALRRREPGAAALLERALARYRGDLLDGEPAGDWHLEARERLQRLHVDALVALGDALAADGEHARAAAAYRRVLAVDDLHEGALRALMRCLAAQGERAPALRAYREFAERLRGEFDAEPGDETVRLFERLRPDAGG
jgi:non-specific serine/threonine protein kinase